MDEPSSTKHVLQGRELIEYLVERAAQDARAAITEIEERRKKRVGLIFSALALVGVGSIISALKVFVRSEMDVVDARVAAAAASQDVRIEAKTAAIQMQMQAEVKQKVLDEIKNEIAEVQQKLEENEKFERYAELAARLPEKLIGITREQDKYVAEMLRDTLEVAEQMAARPELLRRPRFLSPTRQIIDVMSRFNREAEIDRFDDLLGEVMCTDPELTRLLIDHYGQLVVGSPKPISEQAETLKRLDRYMRAARQLNYPERELMWSLFVEFKRNGYHGNETTLRLLESTEDLVPMDKNELWFQLYRYTDSTFWMAGEDQRSRELERLMAALQGEYPDITRVMRNTVAASKGLQERLPSAARENLTWLESPPTHTMLAPEPDASASQTPPADAETPTPSAEPPADTAEEPAENLLRR